MISYYLISYNIRFILIGHLSNVMDVTPGPFMQDFTAFHADQYYGGVNMTIGASFGEARHPLTWHLLVGVLKSRFVWFQVSSRFPLLCDFVNAPMSRRFHQVL